MTTEIVMPKLGESVVEGTVSKWLVGEGDRVHQFDPILEVTTDKVDTEIPADATGTVLKLVVPEGTSVQPGTILGWIGEVGEELPPIDTTASDKEDPPTVSPSVPENPPTVSPSALATPDTSRKRYGFVSPVVARLAAEHNVDLTRINGTGAGGRITKKDLEHFISENAPAATPNEGAKQQWTPMRQAIAKHMVHSKRTSAHVTTVFEVDMSAVVGHHHEHKTQRDHNGSKVTLTAYFVAASTIALQAHPILNCTLIDDSIVLKDAVNIGVAVSLGDDGLIVPVIKHADRKTLEEIASELNDLVARARARQLQPDEVQDGTFTITNHGISGSLFATAIINQPQCAIIGIGAVQKRPVVEQDDVVVRPMAYLTLSFDHRIIDGAMADMFLAKVKSVLENWN